MTATLSHELLYTLPCPWLHDPQVSGDALHTTADRMHYILRKLLVSLELQLYEYRLGRRWNSNNSSMTTTDYPPPLAQPMLLCGDVSLSSGLPSNPDPYKMPKIFSPLFHAHASVLRSVFCASHEPVTQRRSSELVSQSCVWCWEFQARNTRRTDRWSMNNVFFPREG